jgi:hypothetical protein
MPTPYQWKKNFSKIRGAVAPSAPPLIPTLGLTASRQILTSKKDAKPPIKKRGKASRTIALNTARTTVLSILRSWTLFGLFLHT